MKNAEHVRKVFASVFGFAMQRARYLVSSLDNGAEISDQLRGNAGERMLAQLVDTALLELGHVTQLDSLDQNSSATVREVRKGRIGPRGKLATGVEE